MQCILFLYKMDPFVVSVTVCKKPEPKVIGYFVVTLSMTLSLDLNQE